MLDYKTSGSETLIERVSSANNIDSPISLTWLWEIIVRTKRLPDDLDPKLLFIVIRERLRNVEREVRQHALRVLADLIPVIDPNSLDKHMEFLIYDLVVNLSHVAPAVRKGTVDVLRIYLKHSPHPNEILKKVMTAVPDDNHLKQGLLIAIPYFSTYSLNEDTLVFLIGQLIIGTKIDFLKETAICSLVKTRSKIGKERFNNLLGTDNLQQFEEHCKELNINLDEENVILETQIILNTGPEITMKIHEEEEEEETQETFDDSEPEIITRSPRKVHFGGEVVKMRTPESDSNQHSSDDNDLQTSVIIDRPTSIKITLSDNIAAIKTRHKSMIPVRVTTGSNPSTPKKKLHYKRLHKSAPDLRKLQVSKIPLRYKSKRDLNKSETESKIIKQSREDEFSPIPVHNEIEVLHNLTRSPDRKIHSSDDNSKEEIDRTYPSFQLCNDESEANSLSPLELIVRDLSHKDDVWTRSRAVDDLISLLNKNAITLDSNLTSQLLKQLFLCEKIPRLQLKAQDALFLLISSLSLQILNEIYENLSNDVIKILPPSGVRLSLLLMKRTSPKTFFNTVKVESSDREAALQALIAATRTFPSSEIDLTKGIELAFDAMKDNKRAVRQAALESLASLAQVAGNTIILEAISDLAKNLEDSNHLLTIVRTRLSRRQLPTVDIDGNIRYSSPREQEECDWLCGGVPNLQKTLSLNSIKSSNNYWRHNLRHELDNSKDDANNKESVWSIDTSSFPKIENATLCPVYVLQHSRDKAQLNGKNYRNYDRGRSNSPPNYRQSQDSFTDINGNKAKRYFRQNEQFKKSFSSEQLYGNSSRNVENNGFSLSSRSSTTSTGSSTKSGVWMKEFRSGIPVPINSDVKLKIRTHKQTEFNGPLIAQESLSRTKLESTQPTPIIRRTSAHQFTQQIPPPSSGSESSGYFTPPAEHHSKETSERFNPNESFEENNNFALVPEPNFQVVESETSETHELEVPRQSSASSAETTRGVEEITEDEKLNHPNEEPKRNSPIDEVDFSSNRFVEPRCKSKSEGNLKLLPDITERKNLNSAPPLNDITIVPYSFEPLDVPLKTPLPGSVTSNDNTPTKKQGQSPRRLSRRSLSIKTASLKRNKSPKNSVRPKELLHQALTQMESCDWENVINGLNNLTSLAQNYPEALEHQMHSICETLAKNIKNLRSQVARVACHSASELFSTCKKNLEMELEELAAPLLQRTADTNKFLRSDANAALDAMCLNMSVSRVVAVITNKGSTHQNGVVRGAATRLLSDIAMRIGAEKVFQLPKETRDKFLLVGANGLTEGSLETRKYAKALMSTLINHPNFQKTIVDAVPQHTLRHIAKAIKSLK